MASTDVFIPPDPKNIPIRPLNKGMFRDIPPTLIPKGGMYTVQNGFIKRGGIQKRSGSTLYMGGNQVDGSDLPIIGVAPLWQTDGTQAGCLLTSRYLYTITGYSAPSPQYYSWTVGATTCEYTFPASVPTVTGTGATNWDNDDVFSAEGSGSRGLGDYFVLDPTEAGNGPEIIEIKSIASDTSLVLASAPANAYPAGTTWAIYKRFHVVNETLLDWTTADNKLIITDNKRTPYSFDGTTLTEFDSGISYVCGCLCVMDQRLWLGNIKESGVYHRTRLRWSSATDKTDLDAVFFLDIDHPGSGALRRLLPLGNLLVAYFDDGIHIGRQTNIPLLPRAFQIVESGRIGLIGHRAVTGFLNGHAFVGQDDIYFLSAQGLERIGTPVLEATIHACKRPDKIFAVFDPLNERLVFGFPEAGAEIEKIWSYNYKTKAWSYDLVSCTSLSNPLLDLNLTWSDMTDSGPLAADTWTGLGAAFPAWGDIKGDVSFMELFYSQSGYLLKYTKTSTDDNGVAIPLMITTGDLDFGVPDTDKTIRRLTLRLNHRPTGDLLFLIEGSDDSGNTWKNLGNLLIDTDHIEGRVDFFLTGSALRLKLTSTNRSQKYTISDFTMRIYGRGVEFDSD